MASTEQRPRDACNVSEPAATLPTAALRRRIAFLKRGERQLACLFVLGGMNADEPVAARSKRHDNMAVDRHRQHEAFVVVGVFANQVDAPGRSRDARAHLASELLLKGLTGTLH